MQIITLRLLFSVVLTSCVLSALVRAADARPNIVFIITDDLRWDTLGCA